MMALARALAFRLLVAVLLVYLLFPFYYAVLTSMKGGSAIFSVDYWPRQIDFSNYARIFSEQPFALNILNSVLVAFAVVALSLLLGLTAAFSLGRIRFRGRSALLFAVLAVSMFPQVAVLSGMFELVRAFGLFNSLLSLVFSYMIFTLPFTIWVLTSFMRELPREIEEAAIMDGAGPWTLIVRIFLPLLWPAMVTTGLLAFIVAWNEFLFALTFILSNEQRTVPVAIALITGGSEFELPWGGIMAASVTVTLPLIALVLVFQRRLVAGLTAGAVKG
ncbi:MAG: carbohydrate ABC transporter permease [Alphaproteobacteria bacterium]|nr:carbohydrate ABC transporter permease [Alphaproteobacteria bacterium]